MKCLSVSSYGIQELIDGFLIPNAEAGQGDFYESMLGSKRVYGIKGAQYFENCEISLQMNDIKGIELLVLKQWCPSVVILNPVSAFSRYFKIDDSLLSPQIEETGDFRQLKSDLEKMSDTVYNNYRLMGKYESAKGKFNSYLGMMDVGSIRFNAIIRFEGSNIISLLSGFPESVLYDRTKREFITPGSSRFDNLCAKLFFTNFYDFMDKCAGGIDFLTDVQYNRQYFAKLTDNFALTAIRTPFGVLDFRNMEKGNDLAKMLTTIKGNRNHANISKDGHALSGLGCGEDVTYHFMVHTTLQNMIAMFAYTNQIYYYQDLKILLGTRTTADIPEDLTQSQGIFLDTIRFLDDYRLKILKEVSNEERAKNKDLMDVDEEGRPKREAKAVYIKRLETYEFIPRASMIRFMIKGTKEDFSKMYLAMKDDIPMLPNGVGTIMESIQKAIETMDALLQK